MDNHNGLIHDGGNKYQIGLESARGTTWWTIQVFTFFLKCTEVSTYLAMEGADISETPYQLER